MLGEAGQIGANPQGTGGYALDLRYGEVDRALVRKAARQWPRRFEKITEKLRERMVDDLELALDDAAVVEDPGERCDKRVSAVKTLAALEAMNQRDEHHAEGENHNHRHQHEHIVVKPPRVLE